MSLIVKVDLRNRFGGARDQGRRPTCVAFAGSDVHAAVRAADFIPLSVEYAFYRAVKRKGGVFNPDSGVTLLQMLSAIEQDGQPIEDAWPYLPQTPRTLADYVPPQITTAVFKRGSKYVTCDVKGICKSLDLGTPALVVFWPSMQFMRATAGSVVRGDASERPIGQLHAVVAVGWGEESSERIVLVRNSWGPQWAENGYAWLSESYLQTRLDAVVTMD